MSENENNPAGAGGSDGNQPEVGSDLNFPEPSLSEAKISPDAAQSASLEQVNAEAAQVAAEAEAQPGEASWLDKGDQSKDWDNAFSSSADSTGAGAAAPATGPAPGTNPAPGAEAPSAANDWGADETTTLRTNFNEPPVVNNPWTRGDTAAQQPSAGANPPASAPSSAQHAAPAQPETPPAAQPTAATQPLQGLPERGAPSGWAPPAGGATGQNAATQPVQGQPGASNPYGQTPSAAQQPGAYGSAQGGSPFGSAPQGPGPQAPGQQPSYGQQSGQPYGAPGSGNPYGQNPAPGGPGVPPPNWNQRPQGPGGQPGPGQNPYGPQGPGVPQGPGGPQGPYGGPQGPSGPYGQNPNGQNPKNNNKLWIIGGIALVVVALLVVIVILFVNLSKGGGPAANQSPSDNPPASQSDTPQPSSDPTESSPSTEPSPSSSSDSGVILSNVKPTLWLKGDCLKDYVDINTRTDIVTCSTPHSAQLINTYTYPQSAAFPGKTALQDKGNEICDAVDITKTTGVKEQYAYPTESTWADGDRLIQCIAYTSDKKNTLTKDLVK